MSAFPLESEFLCLERSRVLWLCCRGVCEMNSLYQVCLPHGDNLVTEGLASMCDFYPVAFLRTASSYLFLLEAAPLELAMAPSC